MSRYFLFSSYHNSDKNISTHTLGGNFKSFCEVNQNSSVFFFFMFFSIPRHIKRKPSGGGKSCVYKCVPRRANISKRPTHNVRAEGRAWTPVDCAARYMVLRADCLYSFDFLSYDIIIHVYMSEKTKKQCIFPLI